MNASDRDRLMGWLTQALEEHAHAMPLSAQESYVEKVNSVLAELGDALAPREGEEGYAPPKSPDDEPPADEPQEEGDETPDDEPPADEPQDEE